MTLEKLINSFVADVSCVPQAAMIKGPVYVNKRAATMSRQRIRMQLYSKLYHLTLPKQLLSHQALVVDIVGKHADNIMQYTQYGSEHCRDIVY